MLVSYILSLWKRRQILEPDFVYREVGSLEVAHGPDIHLSAGG
jgi:hypothetical protein